MKGYHANTYRDSWVAVLGEEMSCQREVGNWINIFLRCEGMTC